MSNDEVRAAAVVALAKWLAWEDCGAEMDALADALALPIEPKVGPVAEPSVLQELADAAGGKIDWVAALPDGSGAATMSFPLPADHWLTRDHYNVPPMPFRKGTDALDHRVWTDAIRAAGKYAIRAATMNGKEYDFDPDAMLQNLLVGMLGYWTPDGTSTSCGDPYDNPDPLPPIYPPIPTAKVGPVASTPASAGNEVAAMVARLKQSRCDDGDPDVADDAASLIELLAAQLRENEKNCRASDQKEFPATYRAWEKKWVAQGAELAAMTEKRDKAVRMFKAAIAGQDRWLPCIEHRFKVDYRVSGCPQCQIEKAIARAEAAEPDALRWRECVGHADGTGCGFPAGHRDEWLVVSRPDGQIITGATPNETVDAAIARGAA